MENCKRFAVPAGPLFLHCSVEACGAARQQNRTATESKATGSRKDSQILCHFLSLGLFFDRLGCILVNFWSRLRPSGCFMVKFWSPWGPFGITFGDVAVPLAKQAPGYSRQISRKLICYDFGSFLGAFWGRFWCPKSIKKQIEFGVRF